MADIIPFNPRGIESAEVTGVKACTEQLPADWFGFANKLLTMPSQAEQAPEIDLFLFTDDHVFLIDFKHWSGKIENRRGIWYRNGDRRARSPVNKIVEIAKKFPDIIKAGVPALLGRPPRVEACVVFTNENVDLSGLSDEERPHVWRLAKFIELLNNEKKFYERFNKSAFWGKQHSLCGKSTRDGIDKFFRGDRFKIREAVFEGYKAEALPTFIKKNERGESIYSEYVSELIEDPEVHALLRYWDFRNLSAEFLSYEPRKRIADRERAALKYLERVNVAFYDDFVLKPIAWDKEYGVNYWEIIGVRDSVRRIVDFINRARHLSFARRIELSAAVLARAEEMHTAGLAHRDLGKHSVWFDESRERVMLSTFTAAHFPERTSIGSLRYQIATALRAPTASSGTQVPSRVDVFQLAALVWEIISGKPLTFDSAGAARVEELDLEPNIDAELKRWFRTALAFDEDERFNDGAKMLAEFLAATGRPDAAIDFDAALARFESRQPALASFPVKSGLTQRPRALLWESEVDEQAVVVKQWARSQSSDWKASLLQFLERAQRFVSVDAPWLPAVVAFGWHSGDCFVAQRRVDAESWIVAIEKINDLDIGYALIESLVRAVDQLHAIGFAHGDITEENLLVQVGYNGVDVILLDLFDYCPDSDGVLTTPEPATEQIYFDPFVRDRAAVGRLAKRLLDAFDVVAGADPGPELTASAINECETSAFPWQSLAPILSSFEQAREFANIPSVTLRIGVPRFGKGSRILSRDGLFDVVLDPKRSTLSIYGLDEAVELKIGTTGVATASRVISAPDAANFAHQMSILKFHGIIELYEAEEIKTSDVSWLLKQEAVREALRAFLLQQEVPQLAESASPSSALSEQVRDIRALWQGSIEVEDEAIPRIRLTSLAFDAARGAHMMRFDEDLSSLINDGDERIQLRSNGWVLGWTRPREIRAGQLAAYDCRSTTRLVAGDVISLQTTSNRENLNRRSRAVERVLSGQSIIPDLIEYLEPWGEREIVLEPTEGARSVAEQKYELRNEQVDAFELCLSSGPVTFVHGPPGTGKTKFIAALVHYGIESGRYGRVIVSSQSNEAVNNVAERLQALFGDAASSLMLRVGPQSNVSETVMPLHSEAIQGRYRERFIAEETLRIVSAAADLGLPSVFAEAVVDLIKRARRISAEMLSLENAGSSVSTQMAHALTAALREVGIELADDEDAEQVYLARLMDRYGVSNHDAAARLERLIKLGGQWRAALAGGRRSLEELFCASRDIVVGTCVGLGRAALRIETTTFDLAIIDEAARCSPGELAIAMQSAKKVVLVGDHKQLPPYLERENLLLLAERLGVRNVKLLEESDFERGIRSQFGKISSKRLNSQWRMSTGIGQLVSSCFYDGELQTAKSSSPEAYGYLASPLDSDVTWLDTSDLEWHAQEERIGRYDVQNEAEVNCIISVLRSVSANEEFWRRYDRNPATGVDAPIGIICTYRKQVELLEQRAYTSGLSAEFLNRVKMGTVDSYQGKENPIVILSLVRNNNKQDVGYLRDQRRINVSMSRAMERLLIVGSFAFFGSFQNPLEKVAQYVATNRRDCNVVGASRFWQGRS